MGNSDLALVELAMTGDLKAFNALVTVWHKRIFNFSKRYLGDYDEAQEVVQKTFIKAYQSLHTLKDSGKFQAWLYIIAGNMCHDAARRSKRYQSEVIPDSETTQAWEMQVTARFANPEQEFRNMQLGQILEKAMAMIPEEQRVVVIMKEYEGLKFSEIAVILEISENTAKSRLYYGLKALKKILELWKIDKEAIDYEF
jgi:RNA polymerase sigma factor (sigma-70 family)